MSKNFEYANTANKDIISNQTMTVIINMSLLFLW